MPGIALAGQVVIVISVIAGAAVLVTFLGRFGTGRDVRRRISRHAVEAERAPSN